MSMLDLMIAFVVLLGLWRGFRAGAMKTALSLVSWLIALVTASKLAKSALSWVRNFSDNEALQLALAFLLVFFLTLILLQAIVYLFRKALKGLKLDFVDQLLGGILGACVGLLKVLLVLSVSAPLLSKMPVWQQSPLAQGLLPLAPMAKTLIGKSTEGVWHELHK